MFRRVVSFSTNMAGKTLPRFENEGTRLYAEEDENAGCPVLRSTIEPSKASCTLSPIRYLVTFVTVNFLVTAVVMREIFTASGPKQSSSKSAPLRAIFSMHLQFPHDPPESVMHHGTPPLSAAIHS